MTTDIQEFFATCPKGFEQLLGQELSRLSISQIRPLSGQVSFRGTLADAYRVCLWSRLASRVVLVLGRISATQADELYAGVSEIDWEAHISPHATFAVNAHGTNSELRNAHFTAVRVKDAIVDQLIAKRGSRPMVNTEFPDVTVTVRITKTHASLGIDLAGDPLFKRGIISRRTLTQNLAPLRPDYAAALLAAHGIYGGNRSEKRGRKSPETPAYEAAAATPSILFSGAGSLVHELVGIRSDCAPGLLRTRWGMLGWAGHDSKAWSELIDEATYRANACEKNLEVCISDTRPKADVAVRHSLRASGLSANLTFLSPKELAEHTTDGGVVADMSWFGHNLAVQGGALSALAHFVGAKATVLSPDETSDTALGQQSISVTNVLVGKAPAGIRTYAATENFELPPTVTVRAKQLPVLVGASDQFSARLTKVAKLRARWAKREDISCYRIYDADLPDYAVSIDLYQGCTSSKRWLQISEYAAPHDIDATLAKKRLLDVLTIAPEVLEVPPHHVNLRIRTRAKGGSQYVSAGEASANARNRTLLIDEGGLTFEVDFSQHLDCGIFLDHRQTRAMIREMMKAAGTAKSFLNLFAYTGTATCYAADGGALHTTTVDLSKPSLEWARRNMCQNGFDGQEHEFVQADALTWITEQRRSKNRWNVIFCDVPTFSNSSRMKKASFDVQRDHAELIIGISRLLTRGGVALFSCNLRSFKPDVEKIERAGVSLEDITKETIPEDFARNQKIHHCYRVTRVK